VKKLAKSGVLVLLVAAAWPSAQASAHIRLMYPMGRDQRDDHKDNLARDPGFVLPCGIARTAQQPVTELKPGQSVTVQWTETVDHTGCFYIDFANSDAGPFQVLAMVEDGANSSPKNWTQMVTIPANATGDQAVLRLRQDMSGKKACPAMAGSMESYFACGNVRVTGAGGGTDGGASGGSGGGADAGSDARAGTGGATGGAGTGGATGGAASGGSSTGGASSATGGAPSNTGGASNATGGANNATGGANNATGGRTSTGGASPPSTGGSSSGEGGGCAVTGAGSSRALAAGVALASLALLVRRRRSRRR
jgi:hypothetical protein